MERIQVYRGLLSPFDDCYKTNRGCLVLGTLRQSVGCLSGRQRHKKAAFLCRNAILPVV